MTTKSSAVAARPPRTLCAILLNPALRDQASTTTHRNVSAAVSMVDCELLVIANLLNSPTRDALELNQNTPGRAEVEDSRRELTLAIQRADEVLVAWGMGGMTGATRLALRAQVNWLAGTLGALGIEHVWTICGRPRHPSRWRQYVGPEKQRVIGDTYEERLRKVLVPVVLAGVEGQALFARAF